MINVKYDLQEHNTVIKVRFSDTDWYVQHYSLAGQLNLFSGRNADEPDYWVYRGGYVDSGVPSEVLRIIANKIDALNEHQKSVWKVIDNMRRLDEILSEDNG